MAETVNQFAKSEEETKGVLFKGSAARVAIERRRNSRVEFSEKERESCHELFRVAHVTGRGTNIQVTSYNQRLRVRVDKLSDFMHPRNLAITIREWVRVHVRGVDREEGVVSELKHQHTSVSIVRVSDEVSMDMFRYVVSA